MDGGQVMKQQKNSTRGMENKNLAGKKERIKKKVLTGSDLLCLILPQISFVVVFAWSRLFSLAWSCLFRLLVLYVLSCFYRLSCLSVSVYVNRCSLSLAPAADFGKVNAVLNRWTRLTGTVARNNLDRPARWENTVISKAGLYHGPS